MLHGYDDDDDDADDDDDDDGSGSLLNYCISITGCVRSINQGVRCTRNGFVTDKFCRLWPFYRWSSYYNIDLRNREVSKPINFLSLLFISFSRLNI